MNANTNTNASKTQLMTHELTVLASRVFNPGVPDSIPEFNRYCDLACDLANGVLNYCQYRMKQEGRKFWSIILVMTDHENNAERFWDWFREQYPDMADMLDTNGSAAMSLPCWEDLQYAPGFHHGPEFAPAPLLECGNAYRLAQQLLQRVSEPCEYANRGGTRRIQETARQLANVILEYSAAAGFSRDCDRDCQTQSADATRSAEATHSADASPVPPVVKPLPVAITDVPPVAITDVPPLCIWPILATHVKHLTGVLVHAGHPHFNDDLHREDVLSDLEACASMLRHWSAVIRTNNRN